MNKNHHPNQTLIQFVIRAQQLARQDAQSDRGYAMLMTSMISLAMLSLLAAYMTMANMSKSSTDAFVDGNNTFYAAESGLNKRAQQVRDKFVDYATPTGKALSTTAADISQCFPLDKDVALTGDDFECRNYGFTYNNNAAASRDSEGNTVIRDQNDTNNSVNYIAYTYVADKTQYVAGSKEPATRTIPSGETYAGLLTQEYKYSVFATANANQNVASGITSDEMAAKSRKIAYDAAVAAIAAAPAAATAPTPPTPPPATDTALVSSYDSKRSTADDANAKNAVRSSTENKRTDTVLQMDFKSRIVPLFQFAAFYNGDLEINSGSDMSLTGPVHTNSNLYVQPFTSITLSFGGKVTAAGDIYNRVDSYPYTGSGMSRLLLNGNDCAVAGNCFPNYDAANYSPLSTTQINAFGGNLKDKVAGTQVLNVPAPGFLRKRNYEDNKVGDYYAKADMRLEMVPDRRNTNRTIIPFNFTAIRTGGTGTCSTTLPTQAAVSTTAPRVSIDRDPVDNYIDPDRKDASTLHCNKFTKGQLQSLRQPVLVLPNSDPTQQTPENTILGKPPGPPVGTAVTLTPDTQKIILRALQVALASTAAPVVMDTLGKPFNDTAAYAVGTPGGDFKVEFDRLLNTIPITTLSVADRDTILSGTTTPNQIAALGSAWFLPAPIQVVAPADTANIKDAANNTRGSGFYDGREKRWMNVLQTNIASLSVWNRDGLYVEASTQAGTTKEAKDIDSDLTAAYRTNTAMKNDSFSSGTGANFTSDLAFTKSTLAQITAAGIKEKGLQRLGLGSIDPTEGGLVFHATVRDDLNGDGAIADADDVSVDTSKPIYKKNADGTDALKKKADGTNFVDAAGNTVKIIVDYPRKYKNSGLLQSPFGFAFNGGDYLPGPLTLVTDQPIYIQGNFNNNGAVQTKTAPNTPDVDRLPASIIGDAITVLSNECLSSSLTSSIRNNLLVPTGQISCAVPVATTSLLPVLNSTAVNAAFLSSVDLSNGNLGTGRNDTTKAVRFSGGLNNYMRMLERWGGGGTSGTGKPFFNYSGSFVSLSSPLESSGVYGGGNATSLTVYYQIPNRNFNFDDNFKTFTNLPPLSPRAVYLLQDVFKRNY